MGKMLVGMSHRLNLDICVEAYALNGHGKRMQRGQPAKVEGF
jgi:hypothetical protein